MDVKWEPGPPTKTGIYWIAHSNWGFDRVQSHGHYDETINKIMLFGTDDYKKMDEMFISHHSKFQYPDFPKEEN